MNIRAAIAFFALILAGCTQPLDTRIDGSSQGAYEKSLKAIKAKLTPEETAIRCALRSRHPGWYPGVRWNPRPCSGAD
jgi:hypothetical protein